MEIEIFSIFFTNSTTVKLEMKQMERLAALLQLPILYRKADKDYYYLLHDNVVYMAIR